MWFNILTHNHNKPNTLILDYLRFSLASCGHEVTVTDKNIHSRAINIYIENFMGIEPWNLYLSKLLGDGIALGLVNTELITKHGIPYGKYGIPYAEETLKIRENTLFELAPKFDFVWNFLERMNGIMRPIAKFSAYYPYGCIELENDVTTRSPKDIDVLFFGKLTPHREQIIKNIIDQGIKIVCVGSGFPMGVAHNSVLNSLIDRSKIVLNLTLHEKEDTLASIDPRFTSCERVARTLERKVLIISEKIPNDNPYAPYIISEPVENIASTCKAYLEDDNWRMTGTHNALEFSKKMRTSKICDPVIEQTIKHLAKMGKIPFS